MDWHRPRSECYAWPCKEPASLFVEVTATYRDEPFMQSFCPAHSHHAKDRESEKYFFLPSLEAACDHYDHCLKGGGPCGDTCAIHTVQLVLDS